MMVCGSKKLWYAFVALTACYLFAVPCSYCSEVDQDRVSELRKQADKMKTEGYYSKAAALMEEVVAFKKQQSGTSSADVAESLDHLGELYYLAGKYAEAEPLLKESFSIRKEIFGPDHVETAKSFTLLPLKGDTPRAIDMDTVTFGYSMKAVEIESRNIGYGLFW